jgi:hypothetical protein
LPDAAAARAAGPDAPTEEAVANTTSRRQVRILLSRFMIIVQPFKASTDKPRDRIGSRELSKISER